MKRREWYSLLLFTGCVTAISAILLHSVVDFNMQTGANGLYFFLILVLAVSSANTRMRSGADATYLKKSKFYQFPTGITILFLFMAVAYTHGGALIAKHITSGYRNEALWPDMPKNKLLLINQAAKTSSALDLLNPRYAHITANTASMLSNTAEAMQYYERSLRLDPKNSQYLMDAAFFLHRQGKPDLAESLFRTSIQYDKTNMAASIKYAAMLLETKQPEKSLRVMKQAISMDPEITDAFLALMVQYHIDDDRLRFALPDRVKPYLVLGDFFNSLGEKEKAEESFLTALGFLSNEKQIRKRDFLHVYQFYERNRQNEDALRIILKAISHFPDDSGFHRVAGDLYQKLGINYRAEEEFRKAEILK